MKHKHAKTPTMDYKYIEQLLQRYFDGATTPQEETILRTFFSQDNVPQALAKYTPVFSCSAKLADMHTSEGFEERLMQRIAGQDHTAKARRISLTRRLSPLYKAVAGVAVVLCFSLAAQRGMTTDDPSTVTTKATRVAGEQVSVLPQEQQPVPVVDTMAIGQQQY